MRWLAGAIILLAVAALFLAMARTWRTRSRRQAEVVPPVRVPADLGAATAEFDGFYVATTVADDPLQRIASGPWGFRGRGGVRTHDRGVVMTLAGADDRFVAWSDVRGADRATAAIDRVVEPGGLVRLRWTATGAAGATDLDSYFRFPAGDAGVLAALRGPISNDTKDPLAGDEGER
ncbi:PH-like domain-containing protein [Curtobacterium sp. Leaf261]|uniref:PH-like domain-containing protein n=1 Tax=Curtobacterium sp. Leaf261 TaxID=1736311 RepID=UPI0006F4E334|nr:hypothetical protein [Curtobacterium sp. Leaf261]KQO64732.1 hypothetical protein ASF23_00540 [Curtobacterium sp. Leaf261]